MHYYVEGFFDKSRRISFCVLQPPKTARRKGLRLPYMAEFSENAAKRVPGAKNGKSPAFVFS